MSDMDKQSAERRCEADKASEGPSSGKGFQVEFRKQSDTFRTAIDRNLRIGRGIAAAAKKK